ncbi:hypothetical protein GGGNBK_19045 [Sporosarcina sp. ANT_H38]
MNTDWGMFSLFVIVAVVVLTGMWFLGESSGSK